MNKSMLAVLVLTPALAYPAASWWMGSQAEKVLDRQYGALAQNDVVRLVSRQTERGVFSTHDTAVFELRPEFIAEITEGDDTDEGLRELAAMRLTLRNEVQHGPLPGLSALGLAHTLSTLQIDHPKVKALYADQPVMRVDTQLDFNGAGRSRLRSPAVQATLDGRLNLAWSELVLDTRFNADQTAWTAQGGLPSVSMQDADGGAFKLDGLTLHTEQKQVNASLPNLYAGTARLDVKHIELSNPEGKAPPLTLRGFALLAESREANGFMDVGLSYSADELRMADLVFQQARFAMNLRHLQAAALAELDRVTREQRQADGQADALQPKLPPLQVLLENSPQMEIKSEVQTPQGGIDAAAMLSLPNARVGDLRMAEQNPLMVMNLLSALHAEVSMGMPESVAVLLLAERAEMLPALLQAGYVMRENGRISTNMRYAQGQITINGQALDPSALLGGAR